MVCRKTKNEFTSSPARFCRIREWLRPFRGRNELATRTSLRGQDTLKAQSGLSKQVKMLHAQTQEKIYIKFTQYPYTAPGWCKNFVSLHAYQHTHESILKNNIAELQRSKRLR